MPTPDIQRLAAVRAYHRASTHHFERFAAGPDGLDWETQPDPFRRYVGAPLIPLAHTPRDTGPTYADAMSDTPLPATPVTHTSISSLFEDSLALSAWKQYHGTRWALRVNPSSGNLHPTEGYLLCGAIDGVTPTPALFHYAPREHALEQRADLSDPLWRALSAQLPQGTFFVGLTSIHWREAWKYGMRAFRYCQHDVGHAIGALAVAARALGWSVALCDDLSSDDLAALLGVRDARGAEPEAPDVLLAVVPQATAPDFQRLPRELPPFELAPRGEPNALSPEHVDWNEIDAVSEATRKPRTRTTRAGAPGPAVPSKLPAPLTTSSLRVIVRARRSAVRLDGRTTIARATFFRMLAATLGGAARALPWSPSVHCALFVHRVDGVDPGLYVLARSEDEPAKLRAAMDRPGAWTRAAGAPEDLPLFAIETGDARRIAARVSCHQEIAGDGAFSLGMIARFEGALAEHGPWFYPRLYWECGVLGQILYLEAEAASVRATGIGCFFDSAVHRVLGLADERYQSLYHFTVGGPVDDPRLTTLPAYPPPTD